MKRFLAITSLLTGALTILGIVGTKVERESLPVAIERALLEGRYINPAVAIPYITDPSYFAEMQQDLREREGTETIQVSFAAENEQGYVQGVGQLYIDESRQVPIDPTYPLLPEAIEPFNINIQSNKSNAVQVPRSAYNDLIKDLTSITDGEYPEIDPGTPVTCLTRENSFTVYNNRGDTVFDTHNESVQIGVQNTEHGQMDTGVGFFRSNTEDEFDPTDPIESRVFAPVALTRNVEGFQYFDAPNSIGEVPLSTDNVFTLEKKDQLEAVEARFDKFANEYCEG